ncbi:pilus assembly protein TadG-related protein [Sphingomonas sp. IW22]|uniref:pilus assembly protein TadG-related protein n=1 Tax=Sphingomonas sp. IW22 TaxID=3242489 RepID=UPI003522BBD3
MLAITAAAMIPLCGMIGGGLDLSRIYIVKTRLQHACDAGALAGRKSMGGGTWGQQNNMPRAMAERFFDANIRQDVYGATEISRSYAESAGKITGTASAKLPMTLMRVLGKDSETLSVTCETEMRLPNTDVMFVLDVTGSMGSKAVSSDTETKIVGLRRAVLCFYEIVARLDTTAVCDGGAPSGGTGNQVQIRFGFVPYNTNVNVGYLLPTNFFADRWSYQSRRPEMQAGYQWVVKDGYPKSSYEDVQLSGVAKDSCNDQNASRLNTRNEQTSGNTRRVIETIHTVTGWSGRDNGTCYGKRETKTTESEWRYGETFRQWVYEPVEHPVGRLKNGSQWNRTLQLPLGREGADTTIRWDGCIEERKTVTGTNFDPIPANAIDLQIDRIPDSDDSRWAPLLQDVIYTRRVNNYYTRDTVKTSDDLAQHQSYSCPTEGRTLQQWNDPNAFSSYVNSLQPSGNTYHDIGLLWGARLMSPTGIFASSNAFTPQGGEIQRHVIFMTDGDTVTSNFGYSAYGVPWYDRRNVANPGGTGGSFNNEVNARFSAICREVRKLKDTTLWVISFGDGSNSTTEQRLEQCATSGRYFTARDSAALQRTFRSIADQISALRLTK